jgi:hypothetical protein
MRDYPTNIIPPISHALFNPAIKSVHDERLSSEIAAYFVNGMSHFAKTLQISHGEIVVRVHHGFPTNIEVRIRHNFSAVSAALFDTAESHSRYKDAIGVLESSAGCLAPPHIASLLEDVCWPHVRLAKLDYGTVRVPLRKTAASNVVVSAEERVKATSMLAIGNALYRQPEKISV